MSASTVTFKTKLAGESTGPTGIVVPEEAVETLGKGKRPAVQVTVNGYTYPSTVGSMKGKAMIPFAAEHRSRSGLKGGDEIEVTLTLEEGPRTVEVPEALATALASVGVREKFDALAPSKRKEFVRQVVEAKADDTRQRRIAKVLESLS